MNYHLTPIEELLFGPNFRNRAMPGINVEELTDLGLQFAPRNTEVKHLQKVRYVESCRLKMLTQKLTDTCLSLTIVLVLLQDLLKMRIKALQLQ